MKANKVYAVTSLILQPKNRPCEVCIGGAGFPGQVGLGVTRAGFLTPADTVRAPENPVFSDVIVVAGPLGPCEMNTSCCPSSLLPREQASAAEVEVSVS